MRDRGRRGFEAATRGPAKKAIILGNQKLVQDATATGGKRAASTHGKDSGGGEKGHGWTGRGWGRARFARGFATAAAAAAAVAVVGSLPPVSCEKGRNVSVLAWGGGLSGELGTGSTRGSNSKPFSVEELPGDVELIAAGAGFSAATTRSGGLYTWGNGKDGKLGHGDTRDAYTPRRVEAMDGRRIVSLDLGRSHGAAVDESGKLFAWGRGWSGQLGTGDKKGRLVPTDVALPPGVKAASVACGGQHTLVVTEDGQLLGAGHIYGGGGRGSSRASNDDVNTTFQRIELPGRCRQAACGHDFSLALLEDGRVLSFGGNEFSQCGHGSNQTVGEPRVISALSGVVVDAVAAGEYHASALVRSNGGRVYSWGYGKVGQLGVGSAVDISIPTVVASLSGRGIVGMWLGNGHSAALSSKAELMVWGRGREGQLGRGDEVESPVAYRTLPVKVDALPKHCKVVSVACGSAHTLCSLSC